MKLAITPVNGAPTGPVDVDVSEITFGREFNAPLVHQVVISVMASFRAGTQSQKTRAEVQGGGKKPWRQKGTGRARAGTIRSPLWRGGGIVFAAKPRDYTQKINKKMYRGALQAILSELVRQDRLLVVNEMTLPQPKTKLLLEQLKSMNLSRVLIVTDYLEENLYLASRNLPNVLVIDAMEVNPVDLIKFDHVLMTVPALKMVEGMVGNE